MYQYFIKVVPTVYHKLSGEVCVYKQVVSCTCINNPPLFVRIVVED